MSLHLELEQIGIGIDATVHVAGLDQLGDLVSVAHSKESPAAQSLPRLNLRARDHAADLGQAEDRCALLSMRRSKISRWNPCKLLRRLMGVALHIHIDELERRRRSRACPSSEPVVGALHLLERDSARITDHEAALAQVFHSQRRNLRIRFGVIVDE